jgi:hypothetical protein
VFVVLLTRVLLVFDLNLLLPLSKVDENMARAHARNPVGTQKWWFRKDVTPDMSRDRERSSSFSSGGGSSSSDCGAGGSSSSSSSSSRRPRADSAPVAPLPPQQPGAAAAAAAATGGDPLPSAPVYNPSLSGTSSQEEELFEEMTLGEIMSGKGDYFPGLVPLVYAYLEHIHCEASAFQRIDAYLTFLSKRASGELQTAADWMRDFVTGHADYKGDSVVSPAIAHDLMQACDAIGRGTLRPAALFGAAAELMEPLVLENAYGSMLARDKISANCRESLIRRLTGGKLTRRKRKESDAEELRLSASESSSSASPPALSADTATGSGGGGSSGYQGEERGESLPRTPKEIGEKYLSTIEEAAAAGLRDF